MSSDNLRGSLSNQVIQNVVVGAIRSVVLVPVPFLLTPLILYKIGAKGYGTWAILLAINGMTSLTDLGLVGAVSKFVAEHNARNERHELSSLLSTALVVFAALAGVVVVVLWAIAPIVTRVLFRSSTAPSVEIQSLFRCFLVAIGANIMILFFSSITTGLQRLDITNILSAINIILAAATGAVGLWRGWGLHGLVTGQMLGAVITCCAYIQILRYLLPNVRINPVHFDSAKAKRIFTFSLQLYFTQAAVAVHNNIEKLLLAAFAGIEAAGMYDIANDIALKIRGMAGSLLGPIMPAASELGALDDKRRTVELYYRAQKYLALIGVPIVCITVACAGHFLELWIGPKYVKLALPLSVLVAVNIVNLTTGPGFLILAGNGNLGPGMKAAVVGIVLNTALSTSLILRFGLTGAVVGTSVALSLASLYFLYLFHSESQLCVTRVVRDCLAAPVVYSALLDAIVFWYKRDSAWSWYELCGRCTVFAVLYVTTLVATRYFDKYEWSKLESIFPLVRHARRLIPIA